jgi:hypothetical protein
MADDDDLSRLRERSEHVQRDLQRCSTVFPPRTPDLLGAVQPIGQVKGRRFV